MWAGQRAEMASGSIQRRIGGQMTTKQQVYLDTYRKAPRLLAEPMVVALEHGGGLHPVLVAVANDHRLRLDIRYRRFNVYYGGGSLMLVDGRKSNWALCFDEKYFKGGTLKRPTLPTQFSAVDHARAWVDAFPKLIAGMDAWWNLHPKVERHHCQAMAAANCDMATPPQADYLVLDLEYQWAQRRFDMVAAKRRPTSTDTTGWREPELVFVEVKSEPGACSGPSGLGAHAHDYQDIINARGGQGVRDIKTEYQNVIAQKIRLGLLKASLGFERFLPVKSELLMVFIDLNPKTPSMRAALNEVRKVSGALGADARIRFMRLDSSNYVMTAGAAVSVDQLINEST